VATKTQIAQAVWPEHAAGTHLVSDAMVEEVVRELRDEIEVEGSEIQHIEHIPGEGYRFLNVTI